MERTLVLIKPDAMQRGLTGEILHRFERKGIKIIGLKMHALDDALIDEWYGHHKGKSFFAGLKAYMQLTPVIAIVLEGLDVITTVRKLVGVTKGREADTGSIRGDFGMSGQQNLIHASDSPEAAQKEIGLIFNENELFTYLSASECLIYGEEERIK